MTRCKQTWIALFAASLCAAYGSACKSSDNGGGTGGAGTGGAGTGTGGDMSGTGGMNVAGMGGGGTGGSGSLCVNMGDDNADCPTVKPQNGDCAPKGACCHRASNIAKEAMLGPDDPATLSYRVEFQETINQPMTIGQDLIKSQVTQVVDTEQQSLLFQFQVPRKGGQEVSGMGKSTIQVGRYNCDGTYSFYDSTAAPANEVSSDTSRWAPKTVDMMVDTTKTGADRYHIPFAGNPNRDLTYTTYLNLGTFAYDWELIDQGLNITEFDTSDAGRDCVGSRSGTKWVTGGKFEVYTPLKGNDKQVIASIMQKYCQLVSFGILPVDSMGNKVDTPCSTERCMPGTADCAWKKLPDALCPETDTEKGLFGCHLGAQGNPNGEDGYPTDAEIACTMDAPTVAQDPDMGVTTKGQCCDPLGTSTTLPACNAYRLIQAFTLAAATITDDQKHDLQPNCNM